MNARPLTDRHADWTSLPAAGRAAAAAAIRRRALALQPAFGAFVEIGAETAPGGGALGDGALGGLTYGAKDMFALPGRRPGLGLAGRVDPTDLVPGQGAIGRLDALGAVRIGFTAMTPLAYEPSGAGVAVNPWNPDFVPGGSSTGSAVAVAIGAAHVALGSDTAGSLRIPAHCCGVTAWKPSAGLVPADDAMRLAPSLDTVGLLGTSARDLLAVAAALFGPSPAVDAPVAVRVAQDALAETEDGARPALTQAVDALREAASTVDRTDALPLIDRAGDGALVVLEAEAAQVFADQADLRACDPALAKRLARGRSTGPAELDAARRLRDDLLAAFDREILGDAAVLALPVMPIRTPPVTECDPRSDRFRARTLYALSRFTRFANLLGAPSVAVPAGLDDRNMPVGLQLVGRPGSDAILLSLAAAFQRRCDWHLPMPAGVTTRSNGSEEPLA